MQRTPGWLYVRKPRPEGRVRLICVPYAGSGASMFLRWWDLLPNTIDVRAEEMPGRWARRTETPLRSIQAVIAELGPKVVEQLDRPFALFGCCLGGLIAFELARWLRKEAGVEPVSLVVAAAHAPMSELRRRRPIHGLPDDEMLDELAFIYGEVPETAGLSDPDVREHFCRAIRADMEMLETYTYRAESPLTTPVIAFGGTEDIATTVPALRAWERETTGEFALHLVPGHHYFFKAQEVAIAQAITRALEPAVVLGPSTHIRDGSISSD